MDQLKMRAEIPDEFSLKPIEKSEIIIAMRYHAILFALQMGKPFIPIFNTNKVKSFVDSTPWAETILYVDNKISLKKSYQINKDAIDPSKIVSFSREMNELAWEAAKVFLSEIKEAVELSQKQKKKHFFRIRKKIRNIIHYF
jgi:polysaccharide pyruvyl transferase WcaK-like protein